MKILVISDLHCNSIWKKIVDRHFDRVDKIIFLGDYLDSKSKKYSCDDCLDNLKKIVEFKIKNLDKVVLLLGNHDIYYFQKEISRSLIPKIFLLKYNHLLVSNYKLFNLSFQSNNWIFSHAGITEKFWNETRLFYTKENNFNFQIKDLSNFFPRDLSLKNLMEGNLNAFFSHWTKISTYRGGLNKNGSSIWADKIEFIQFDKNKNLKYLGLKGYFQVVGHNKISDVRDFIDYKNNEGIIFTDTINEGELEMSYIILNTKLNTFKKFYLNL